MIGSDVLSTVLQAITHGGEEEGYILCFTRLVPGVSPTCSTGAGFDSPPTRNAAGDYTLTFTSTFNSTPHVLGIVPFDSAAAGSQVISGYIYTISTSSIRVRFALDDGTLADPQLGYIAVLGY